MNIVDEASKTLVVSFIKKRKFNKTLRVVKSDEQLSQFLDSSYNKTIWFKFPTVESKNRILKEFQAIPHKMKNKRVVII